MPIIEANSDLTLFFLSLSILPSPFELPKSLSPCPGSIFESIHPSADKDAFRTTPFCGAAPKIRTDPVAPHATLEALKPLDASPDVFVIITHDTSP